MVHRYLDHHATQRVCVEGLQEGADISNVVGHVMTHHHVTFGHVVSHVGPVAEILVRTHASRHRGGGEGVEHFLLVIHRHEHRCGRHEG